MTMRVLLPTDFSENAEHAIQYAIDIVTKTNGELYVLHAYDLPYSERSMTTSLLEEMKINAEQNMDDFEKTKLGPANIHYKCKVVLGNPIRLIKETATNQNSDLIVMGTKGASGLEEFLIGSNAASVIHNVELPVLIIPSQAQWKDIKKIVLATDLDLKGKELPLERLKKIATILGAKIEILHFQEHKGNVMGNRDLIEKVLGDTPHSYSISKTKEDLHKSILHYCEEHNGDVVAAITKHYGFFEGLFHKSLVSKLAYHTVIPLLALHEPKD